MDRFSLLLEPQRVNLRVNASKMAQGFWTWRWASPSLWRTRGKTECQSLNPYLRYSYSSASSDDSYTSRTPSVLAALTCAWVIINVRGIFSIGSLWPYSCDNTRAEAWVRYWPMLLRLPHQTCLCMTLHWLSLFVAWAEAIRCLPGDEKREA